MQKSKLLVKIMNNSNMSFSYVYKKSEKLTAAIHIVTGSINSEEPICRQLRDRGINAFSEIIALGTSEKKGTIDVNRARSAIVEVISLLGVAYRAGYISETNHTLLEGEYIDLGVFIEKNAERLTQEETLSQKSLSVSYSDSSVAARFSKGHSRTEKRQDIGHRNDQDGLGDKGRRDTILALLSDKGSVTVRDISHVITNCSEKTIQRELLNMVRDGILRKEGERRWSRYLLVQ